MTEATPNIHAPEQIPDRMDQFRKNMPIAVQVPRAVIDAFQIGDHTKELPDFFRIDTTEEAESISLTISEAQIEKIAPHIVDMDDGLDEDGYEVFVSAYTERARARAAAAFSHLLGKFVKAGGRVKHEYFAKCSSFLFHGQELEVPLVAMEADQKNLTKKHSNRIPRGAILYEIGSSTS